MAAITAATIQPLTFATVDGGFDCPEYDYNEADSATFKIGVPLIGSSGNLVEASTGVKTLIVGISKQPGTNTATAPDSPNYGGVYPAGAAQAGNSLTGTALAVFPLLVVPALPNLIFEGTFANNGSDVAINLTDRWVRYGLSKDSTTGLWYVDKNLTTTNSAVCIVGFKNPQDVTFGTTVGARVFFKFLVAATIYGATA